MRGAIKQGYTSLMNFPVGLFPSPREWAQDLAIATGVGVFLGVIGPFGSFNGGPLELRVFYWIANLWIGWIMLSVIVRLSLRASGRLDLPVWFALPLGVAIGALPLGLTISLFSAAVWPGNHGRVGPFLVWYAQTLAISEPCAFGYYFLTGRSGRYAAHYQAARGETSPAPTPTTSTSPIGGARFLDRLPPRLGHKLLCLQMEDHYVRAHTVEGSDLILMPLKEAMAELGDTEGMLVHRSWWVARAAVIGCTSEGRNLRLRLANGLDVPVSRASIARLRAAGWLDA